MIGFFNWSNRSLGQASRKAKKLSSRQAAASIPPPCSSCSTPLADLLSPPMSIMECVEMKVRVNIVQLGKRHGHPLSVEIGCHHAPGSQGMQGEAKEALTWQARLRSRSAAIDRHHGDDQAETWLLHAIRVRIPLL